MDFHIATFLLLQLLNTWQPDVMSLVRRTPTKLLKTPKLQTPPLIAFLARLVDAPATTHEPEGKVLPCGHKIYVRSILNCSNLFGDRVWHGNSNFLKCPQSNCDTQYLLPTIPHPWAVDGLRARLDLLLWAWACGDDAPRATDVKMGRILQRILDQIGHRPRNSDNPPSSLWSWPSQRRLRQTLRLFDTEGVMGAEGRLYTGPMYLRGTKPYCRSRPSKAPPPGSVHLHYTPPSPGQYCDCVKPHERVPRARDWASTPAEDEAKRDFTKPQTGNFRKTGKPRKKKSVRFAAPVITEIRYFEPWWCDEYRYSTRYYSSGPCRTTVDRSTKFDDDKEVATLDATAVAIRGPKNKRRLPWD